MVALGLIVAGAGADVVFTGAQNLKLRHWYGIACFRPRAQNICIYVVDVWSMADVETLVDFDSPSLSDTSREQGAFVAADVNSFSLMDPFAASYEVPCLINRVLALLFTMLLHCSSFQRYDP